MPTSSKINYALLEVLASRDQMMYQWQQFEKGKGRTATGNTLKSQSDGCKQMFKILQQI